MFLTKDDYKTYIDDEHLGIIQKSSDAIRQKAEKAVESQVQEYLTGRYDVTAIFEQIGDNRNNSLIMHMCDMVIYHLLSGTPGRFVSEDRQKRYDAALSWLEKINKGQLNPAFPYKDEADSGNPIRYNPGTKSNYGKNW